MKQSFFISCKIASQLISKSYEQKLTLKENISLRLHLLLCKFCTSNYKNLKMMHHILQRYSEILVNLTVPESSLLSNDAKSRIKAALSNAA